MPKQEGQKSKLLALLHIFEQQTDENHLLNVPQLVELLAAQGILCERKSVYSDIDALNALGYDIQLRRGRHGGYWMASRTFDLAELKLLVDAVQSSRVIAKTTSDRLIAKLEGLASQYEASQLQRQVYVDGRPKTANKELPASFGELVQLPDYNTGFLELRQGTVDAVVVDVGVGNYQIANTEGDYVILSEPVSVEQYAIGFYLGNEALRDAVNEQLLAMAKDGTMMSIAEKYVDKGLSLDSLCLCK